MDCTIAALLTCFHLSGVYVDSGLSYQDSGVFQTFTRDIWATDAEGHGDVISEHTDTVHRSHSPYGRLALGYQLEFGNKTLSLEASHVSSVATTKDRGINSLSLSMRWFPWR